MTRPIYLDNHATTPINPQVLEAMLPYFTEQFGNPASAGHVYGWEAIAAANHTREIIVKCIAYQQHEGIALEIIAHMQQGLDSRR